MFALNSEPSFRVSLGVCWQQFGPVLQNGLLKSKPEPNAQTLPPADATPCHCCLCLGGLVFIFLRTGMVPQVLERDFDRAGVWGMLEVGDTVMGGPGILKEQGKVCMKNSHSPIDQV